MTWLNNSHLIPLFICFHFIPPFSFDRDEANVTDDLQRTNIHYRWATSKRGPVDISISDDNFSPTQYLHQFNQSNLFDKYSAPCGHEPQSVIHPSIIISIIWRRKRNEEQIKLHSVSFDSILLLLGKGTWVRNVSGRNTLSGWVNKYSICMSKSRFNPRRNRSSTIFQWSSTPHL